MSNKKEKEQKLKDLSKKELIKMVRDQNEFMKHVIADNEYLNGVMEANKLLIGAAMHKLGAKKINLEQSFIDSYNEDFVTTWERDPLTKNKEFEIVDREEYEKKQAKQKN